MSCQVWLDDVRVARNMPQHSLLLKSHLVSYNLIRWSVCQTQGWRKLTYRWAWLGWALRWFDAKVITIITIVISYIISTTQKKTQKVLCIWPSLFLLLGWSAEYQPIMYVSVVFTVQAVLLHQQYNPYITQHVRLHGVGGNLRTQRKRTRTNIYPGEICFYGSNTG